MHIPPMYDVKVLIMKKNSHRVGYQSLVKNNAGLFWFTKGFNNSSVLQQFDSIVTESKETEYFENEIFLQFISSNFGFYLLRNRSDWKFSLQTHSCYIPLDSSSCLEVRNHHIFCVVSNDAKIWIAKKLTRFTLLDL